MSDHDPSTDVTAMIEPVTVALVRPQFLDDESLPDAPGEFGDEEWPAQNTRRSIRFRMPTAVLLALLLAAAGLWGGSLLQKYEGGSVRATGATTAKGAFARAGGTGSPFASSSSATTGTVTDIIGNTLYVTQSDGSLVKVTLSSSATVTRNAKSSLSGLEPGDSVVVQGTKPSDGSMTASSVSATAAGVTTAGAAGGFGGGASRVSAGS